MGKKKAVTPGPTKAENSKTVDSVGIIHEEHKFPWPIKEDWLPVFRTVIEDASGVHYLAEIQQEIKTKNIRVMRV